ncbi:MAG: hypothetical protein U0V72_10250 [Cytophagales bacterium]
MKLSEVKNSLLKKALESFKDLGFKKEGKFLVKNSGDFKIYLGFGIVNSDNSFPTTFHFGISSRVLANFKRIIFPEKGFKSDDFSGAYGQKQESLFDKKEYPILEYDIKSSSDIDGLVTDLKKYFEDGLIDKLEKLQNNDALCNILNSQETLDESMHLPSTLISALIFYKITENVNYVSSKNKYRELLKEWNDWDRKDLEKAIEFLDSHSQEELLKISETA